MTFECNNCGCNSFENFLRLPIAGTTESYKASAFKSNGEQLVKCVDCGLVVVYPMLDSKEILSGYSNAIDDEYISQMKYRVETFKKCLYKIKQITKLKTGKILDVGAASGAFIYVAKDDGWDAEGIEPCGHLVRWAVEKLGLDKLHSGTLEDVGKGKRFDIITMFDVIEHMNDPKNAMYLVSSLIKDGGYVITNIPDINTIIPKIMGSRWPFYASCHLYYYTPDTLDVLMRKNGFKRIYKGMHWQELSLGYLAYRFEQFNPSISKSIVYILERLGWSDVPIKYYIGQTLFVYKKI